MTYPISFVRVIPVLLFISLFTSTDYGASAGNSGTTPPNTLPSQGNQAFQAAPGLPKTGSLSPHKALNPALGKNALSKTTHKPLSPGAAVSKTGTVSSNAVLPQVSAAKVSSAPAPSAMPGSGQILMQSQQMKMQNSVNQENTASNALANNNANTNTNTNTDFTVDQNGQTIIKKK